MYTILPIREKENRKDKCSEESRLKADHPQSHRFPVFK